MGNVSQMPKSTQMRGFEPQRFHMPQESLRWCRISDGLGAPSLEEGGLPLWISRSADADTIGDVRVTIQLRFIHGQQSILPICILRRLVIKDRIRSVFSPDDLISNASQRDIRLFVEMEELRMVRHGNWRAFNASISEPSRQMSMFLKMAVRDLFRVRVDGTEYAWEDLKRHLELTFQLEPEASEAEVRCDK